jgi:hypothetical protein
VLHRTCIRPSFVVYLKFARDMYQAEHGGASGNYTPQVLYTVPHEVLQYQGYWVIMYNFMSCTRYVPI